MRATPRNTSCVKNISTLLFLSLFSQAAAAQVGPVLAQYLGSRLGSARGPEASEPKLHLAVDTSLALELVDHEMPLRQATAALLDLKPDVSVGTSSPKDVELFRRAGPAVVMVITKDGQGSGTLTGKSGEIITSWHVVNGAKEIGVIFKPITEGKGVSKAEIFRATIVRSDALSDLALIKIVDVPAGREPLRLGDISEIGIGDPIHAIGHPAGNAWTYTPGVIVQYKKGYDWTAGVDGRKHNANVVQTKTPGNPGNSGGPLVSDAGGLIGVNSYRFDAEALNFAVSVEDVRRFLAGGGTVVAEGAADADAKPGAKCQPKVIYKGKTKDEFGEMVAYDLKCKGRIDFEVFAPYNRSEPAIARLDRNHDSKPDVLIFDFDRNGKWDLSLWDDNFDGTWDLVGFHLGGELEPSRYESYASWEARGGELRQ